MLFQTLRNLFTNSGTSFLSLSTHTPGGVGIPKMALQDSIDRLNASVAKLVEEVAKAIVLIQTQAGAPSVIDKVSDTVDAQVAALEAVINPPTP